MLLSESIGLTTELNTVSPTRETPYKIKDFIAKFWQRAEKSSNFELKIVEKCCYGSTAAILSFTIKLGDSQWGESLTGNVYGDVPVHISTSGEIKLGWQDCHYDGFDFSPRLPREELEEECEEEIVFSTYVGNQCVYEGERDHIKIPLPKYKEEFGDNLSELFNSILAMLKEGLFRKALTK
tara:strand:- start:9 stop:551 length:543 start_codon:yes stop_codon:yes gene_type:complete